MDVFKITIKMLDGTKLHWYEHANMSANDMLLKTKTMICVDNNVSDPYEIVKQINVKKY